MLEGMIEALMYKLDILLSKQQGQIGNRYQNLPARLKRASGHPRTWPSSNRPPARSSNFLICAYPNSTTSYATPSTTTTTIPSTAARGSTVVSRWKRSGSLARRAGSILGNGRDGARPSENHQGDSRHRPASSAVLVGEGTRTYHKSQVTS